MLILTPSGGELSVDSMLVRIAESARRERFVRREAEAMSRDARWPLRLVARNRARRLCEGDSCAVHGVHAREEGSGRETVIEFGGSAS
jgi:hypothetical protein